MKTMIALGLSLALFGCHEDATDKADNTERNERDRDDDSKTPLDQKENDVDLKITQTIREAVVDDESLSMDAKNVKIITADGVVTLRGPVKSTEEKATIAAKAKAAGGVKSVDDQLEVAAN